MGYGFEREELGRRKGLILERREKAVSLGAADTGAKTLGRGHKKRLAGKGEQLGEVSREPRLWDCGPDSYRNDR